MSPLVLRLCICSLHHQLEDEFWSSKKPSSPNLHFYPLQIVDHRLLDFGDRKGKKKKKKNKKKIGHEHFY